MSPAEVSRRTDIFATVEAQSFWRAVCVGSTRLSPSRARGVVDVSFA